MTAMTAPAPDIRPRLAAGRLGLLDLGRIAGRGLSARRLRSGLTALGIAIGIAAMVAVVGISSSSRAELDGQLDALGTNLLTVTPGTRLNVDGRMIRGMLAEALYRWSVVQRDGQASAWAAAPENARPVRRSTRSTLTSRGSTSSPNAKFRSAAAVYGPTPGSAVRSVGHPEAARWHAARWSASARRL